MSYEINQKAALLGRMLTHFQLSAGRRAPLPLVKAHVGLVHKVSGELLALLGQAPAGTVVEIDTRLGDATADLLAEVLQGEATPDTVPGDWTDPLTDGDGRCEHGYYLTGGTGTCPMPPENHRPAHQWNNDD